MNAPMPLPQRPICPRAPVPPCPHAPVLQDLSGCSWLRHSDFWQAIQEACHSVRARQERDAGGSGDDEPCAKRPRALSPAAHAPPSPVPPRGAAHCVIPYPRAWECSVCGYEGRYYCAACEICCECAEEQLCERPAVRRRACAPSPVPGPPVHQRRPAPREREPRMFDFLYWGGVNKSVLISLADHAHPKLCGSGTIIDPGHPCCGQLGLFATQAIPTNTIVTLYTGFGSILPKKEAKSEVRTRLLLTTRYQLGGGGGWLRRLGQISGFWPIKNFLWRFWRL